MLTKINIFKSCNFVGSKPKGLSNKLCFALSLTVSKMKHVSIQNFAHFIHILPFFDRLVWNDIGVITVKFQSIISKHVASINVLRISRIFKRPFLFIYKPFSKHVTSIDVSIIC